MVNPLSKIYPECKDGFAGLVSVHLELIVKAVQFGEIRNER